MSEVVRCALCDSDARTSVALEDDTGAKFYYVDCPRCQHYRIFHRALAAVRGVPSWKKYREVLGRYVARVYRTTGNSAEIRSAGDISDMVNQQLEWERRNPQGE